MRAGGRPEHGVHAHAPVDAGRSTSARAGGRSPGTVATLARPGATSSRARAHPPRGPSRGAVHDRARIQDVALRERRLRAARAHHAQVVAGALAAPPRRRGSRRSHHERRARAHLARARDADLYAKYMGADWRDHLADPRMWAHRQRPRRRAVGDAPGAQGGAGALRAPARRRATPPQRLSRGAGVGGQGRARSRR